MDISRSFSIAANEELEKLVLRMFPPRVIVDNASNQNSTLIKVDSANRFGSLLEVVQVFSDLDLKIRKAYICSDGGWFMDVFHVTDKDGNKITEDGVAERIQQSLGSFRCLNESTGIQSANEHTAIELTGKDRPGLLSDVFALLLDLNCNVVKAEFWTHNSRMGSIVNITEGLDGSPIDDPDQFAEIKQLLMLTLEDSRDRRGASTAVTVGSTPTPRRLHQMMYADLDFDNKDNINSNRYNNKKPLVTVDKFEEKKYSVIVLRCPDRPKLLFDTVCTLTEMQYVVFHGTVIAEGPEAYQEYYVRHVDGCPINSEAERERVINCLEAAIRRRTAEGLRLELHSEDRVGLLSDVTRIFKENDLSVTHAEVRTRGSQAVNVFYVTDSSGNSAQLETVKAVVQEIGQDIVQVKDEDGCLISAPEEGTIFSQVSNLVRSIFGKIFYSVFKMFV